jgi:hypothetical protein
MVQVDAFSEQAYRVIATAYKVLILCVCECVCVCVRVCVRDCVCCLPCYRHRL